jgi:hypothetical protein
MLIPYQFVLKITKKPQNALIFFIFLIKIGNRHSSIVNFLTRNPQPVSFINPQSAFCNPK